MSFSHFYKKILKFCLFTAEKKVKYHIYSSHEGVNYKRFCLCRYISEVPQWVEPVYMGGNSAETLHPATYTPMRGVEGSRDGGLLFAQIYNFFSFLH